MAFSCIQPLVSKKEAISLRDFILESSNNVDFFCDPKGNKLSLETHKDEGYNLIFSNQILCRLANYVLSDAFLDMLLTKMKSENILKLRNIDPDTINKLVPYCHSSTKNIYGEFAQWKGTLRPLNSSFEKLQNLFNSHINLGQIPVLPRLQLSILQPGTFISPHTDVSNKLASILIYLPSGEEQLNSELGTRFWYSDTDKILFSQKESHQIQGWKESNIFKNARYENTFFGYGSTVIFFRTHFSWHSVEIPKTTKIPRVSVNINLNLPADLNT